MKKTLCPYCMKMTDTDTCPHCGKNTNYTGTSLHLPAGYVVHGKHPYVLGAALGQGGFGITYIALDMVTQERVAIKEYFPTYCAGRTADHAVTAYPNQEEIFQKGKERFLDEARVLKSLSDLKSIVNVLDFFGFNNSAYLVMEFLEGDSLKSHAQKHGKFPAQEFLGKLRPLMEDIDRMHHRGVVHRDIAPDNIIFLPDGQMKLIDFGAARSFVGDKSMTVVVKKGFAPIEQYMRHGSNAATDVYALAATIYYCVTGTVPPDSAERQYDEDMLKTPVSLGAELTRVQEKAILSALEVNPKKRTQSVLELAKGLRVMSAETERRKQEEERRRKEEAQRKQRELQQQEERRKKEEQRNQKALQQQEENRKKEELRKEKELQRQEERRKKEERKQQKAETGMDLKKPAKWILPAAAAILLCIFGGVLFMRKDTPTASVQTEPMQAAVEEITVPETTVPETTVPETELPIILSEEAQKYNEAVALFHNGEYGKAAIAFAKLGDYRDAKQVSLKIWDAIADRKTVTTGWGVSIAVKEDGSVYSCSIDGSEPPPLKDWKHTIAVASDIGPRYFAGLRSDGTVWINDNRKTKQIDTDGWTDIVSIIMQYPFIFGLRYDGTVVAYKFSNDWKYLNEQNEGMYLERLSDLQNIVRIDTYGSYNGDDFPYLSMWNVDGIILDNLKYWNAEQTTVDLEHCCEFRNRLKKDGTVSVLYDSVLKGDEAVESMVAEISTWTNIVSIAGYMDLLGLKADGTVVAANYGGKFGDYVDRYTHDARTWTDIVVIDAGEKHAIGLKSDGTLLAAGSINNSGAKAMASWKNIRLPADRDALLAAIELSYITEE